MTILLAVVLKQFTPMQRARVEAHAQALIEKEKSRRRGRGMQPKSPALRFTYDRTIKGKAGAGSLV
jgi:hypothetical protein